jgi:hypothetical protein
MVFDPDHLPRFLQRRKERGKGLKAWVLVLAQFELTKDVAVGKLRGQFGRELTALLLRRLDAGSPGFVAGSRICAPGQPGQEGQRPHLQTEIQGLSPIVVVMAPHDAPPARDFVDADLL